MPHHTLKVVDCSDAPGSDCHFKVSDTDESEVILAAQEHGRRVHNMEISADDVKKLMKEEECKSCK